MGKVVSLELNELNFELVQQYIDRGELPTFKRLLAAHPLIETVSESGYPHLEPWIQWPTVYTGKTFDEHKVFRLGDIVGAGHRQVWEALEERGVSVGALSPMNAENRCERADFFVPDPWTVTDVTGDAHVAELSKLVSAAVNGNATGGEGLGAAQLGRRLLPFLLRYGRAASLGQYMHIFRYAVKYKWARAAFLDRFLADVFLKLRARKGTQFSSLFLNAGAHIQHHHMFEAGVYEGDQSNPDWYSSAKKDGVDPLLFIYATYDAILRDILALPDTRVLITTGLSQKPNPKTIYQYRFNSHAATVTALGVKQASVTPRMSRDFLLEFPDAAATEAAAARLAEITVAGEPVFTVEKRDRSLFVQIGYFGPIEGLREVQVDGKSVDLSTAVSLVSIENGIHRTIGYHIDTALTEAAATPAQVPLADVFQRMLDCFPETGGPSKNTAVDAREPQAA